LDSDNRGLLQKAWNWLVYTEQRHSLENPNVSVFSDALWQDLDNADKPVNLSNSLSVTAFLRAVNLRADTQASLPFNVFKVDSSGNREIDIDHAAYPLLNDEFNSTMGAFEGRKYLQTLADTIGNGFAEIKRKGNGDPKELWVIPTETDVDLKLKNGNLWYELGSEKDKAGNVIRQGRMIAGDDMYHVKAGYSADGYLGVSPMTLCQDSLGVAISSNAFLNRFFKNNAMPSMVISTEQRLDKEKSDQLKESWNESYGGKKQGSMAVMGYGSKIAPITMPLDQVQMAEIMKHSVVEICRMYGVPPHLLFEMERETFTNIQTADIGFIRYAIRPNSIEWEQEANRKLLRNIQRKRRSHYTEHDLFSLLRGDSEAQANFNQSMHSTGSISSNEIRKQMGWNDIGVQGDQYVMQQGFASVKQIIEKMEAEIAKTIAETENLKSSDTNEEKDEEQIGDKDE